MTINEDPSNFNNVKEGIMCKKCGKDNEAWRTNCKECNTPLLNDGLQRTHADRLSIMANINLLLSIIGAILILCNFSVTSYDKLNWYGILSGFAVLFCGYTIFLLLKTVVDIYNKD